MTDEELNAEILKFICEEKVEQEAEQMEEQMSDLIEKPVHSGETSLFWGVQIKDITQKLDRMELPFQVKHHTRPPDFLSFFSGNNGATKVKKVAHALNGTKYFLPFYCWKRPFKSNAHGIVFNRTAKMTLKPPCQMDFSHVWLRTKNLALAGRQPMQYCCNFCFHILCIHVDFFLCDIL